MRPLRLALVFLLAPCLTSLAPASEPANTPGQTVTVEMWYVSKSDSDDVCPVDGDGNLMKVRHDGATCDEAIEGAYNQLVASCPTHSVDDYDIMISGDCLLPGTATIATPRPTSLMRSSTVLQEDWEAFAKYWCETDAVGSGTHTGSASTAANAIVRAVNELKTEEEGFMCGEEEPYDPVVKITELNGPEKLWLVQITYEFGNGRTLSAYGRGKTLCEADCAAWLKIVELAKENDGLRSGSSRAWGPNVRKPQPEVK